MSVKPIKPVATKEVSLANRQAEHYRKRPDAHKLTASTERGLCFICKRFHDNRKYLSVDNPKNLDRQKRLLLCEGCVHTAVKQLGEPNINAYKKLDQSYKETIEENKELKARLAELEPLAEVRDSLLKV